MKSGNFFPGIGAYLKSGDFYPWDWGFSKIWGFSSPGVGDFYVGAWGFLSPGFLPNPLDICEIPGIFWDGDFLEMVFFRGMEYPTKKPPLNFRSAYFKE